jgi:hypothetical protein
MTLSAATELTDALWQAASALFERTVSRELLPVRLLGVGASQLTRNRVVQGELFDGGLLERLGALDRAVDAIRTQFGAAAIRRGRLVDRPTAGQHRTDD